VVWEAVFMLVLLKIPIVYLALVVWWAIKAEPRDQEPATVPSVSDTPPPGPGWSTGDRVRSSGRGPRHPTRPGPSRARVAGARTAVRR
jgi:hypothetical protein